MLMSSISKYLGDRYVVFDGAQLTAADIVAILKKRIDATNAVALAKAAHERLVTAERVELASSGPALQGIRKALEVMFHSSTDTLVALGIPLRKRRALTVEDKAMTVLKVAATRKARHTMGPRQRQRIHGTVAPPDPRPPSTSNGAVIGSHS
jgi:hypothetical protein